ncbi:MAG: hypothetical protein K0S47_670 [Herbinix sp.]|nr:hypothetical protein [Herbinix sp.]
MDLNFTKILTCKATPGMIVAKDIYTKDDRLVVPMNTRISDKIITRLEFFSVSDFYILVENENSDANTDLLLPSYNSVRDSEAFQRFHMAYKETVDGVKSSFDQIITDESEIDTERLLQHVNDTLTQCATNLQLFDMLHCMRQYDDTTYVHSLNVSLICNIIGKWLHFSDEDLEVITLCGLLHDLGKLMIPSQIMSKPSSLTEDEFSTVKTHTLRGYNQLKSRNLDIRVKHAALMHHERCDGSGYPYGFHNEQIDPFAKLVAIADVYDAMTSARPHRGPLCPFEVVRTFEAEGYTKYDPQYILTFLEGIVHTYLHNRVRLNNQVEGEIIMINKQSLSRPVIKVGENFIDLSKQTKLWIEAII